MYIGHGYDAHPFIPKRPLILAGVKIEHEFGLAAHSDGDVAIHALCDALLGGAGLGDIGQHFSDQDPKYHNIDSRILLRHVVTLLSQKNLMVHNADLTLLAQAPRLALYIDKMRECLAADLQIIPMRVNVKATTTEKMGFVGRKEGIACHAVVLLKDRY